MSLPNPTKTRTWDLLTPANGTFFNDEFDQLYENDNYLGLQANSGYLENSIIDPRMNIWLGGTTGLTTNGYTATMWKTTATSGKTQSVSRQIFTVGQTDVPLNPIYYLQNIIAGTGSGSGYNQYIWQPIRGVEKYSGSKCSISFYAKANTGTPILAVELIQNFGTSSGSPSSDVTGIGATQLTLSTSWQKFTIENVSVPSISSKTLGNDGNDYLGLLIWTSAGTDFDSRLGFALGDQSFTLDIADVVVNSGITAIDIQPKRYDEYLRDTEPYFESFQESINTDFVAAGYIDTTTTSQHALNFKEKILIPSVTTPNVTLFSRTRSGGASDTSTNVTFPVVDRKSAVIVMTSGAGLPLGEGTNFRFGSGASVDVDARI